jgi:hypothetical protein
MWFSSPSRDEPRRLHHLGGAGMMHNNPFHRSKCAQALLDGQLIDVGDIALTAGIQPPVAVTARLWADILAIPESYRDAQDVLGRLWDVIWQARWAMLRAADAPVIFELFLPQDDREMYQVKLIVSSDDDGSPCVTLMRADEG